MAAVLTGQEIHVKNKTCHIMAAVLTGQEIHVKNKTCHIMAAVLTGQEICAKNGPTNEQVECLLLVPLQHQRAAAQGHGQT
jgi:acid stress-induced BolA-like protein IbaG/YrbA